MEPLRSLPPPRWSHFFGLAWILFGFVTNVISVAVCLMHLRAGWAQAALALQLGSVLLPLNLPPPPLVRRFLRFSVAQAREYFPITTVFEDKDAFKQHRPFVVGYEPHSVLPVGACVFLPHSEGMPPSLTNSCMASTSTIFSAPVMRHMMWWLGCRPASRQVLQHALVSGTTVVLVPGGVQECFYMEPGADREVAFLKSRTGFVRLAMEAGAPLVPVFAFGQTPHFSYWRPFIDWPRRLVPRGAMGSLVRRIGYVPMLVWGWLGSACPHRVPMHVVVGKPIQVPQRADPSPGEVQRYLQQYIDALQDIFERHKAAAGHPQASLTIY